MRRAELTALALLVPSIAACNLGADVNNVGGYTALPGAPVADTAPRPLRHLVVVERDAEAELSLIYYFEGDLGAAGIGLEDLRRKELRHGGFQLRFAYPPARYAAALEEASEPALPAEVDGAELGLSKLTSQELYLVGASRFLRTVDEAEFPVRAYFGSLAQATDLGTLRLDVGGAAIAYDFVLGASDVAPRVTDGAVLVERGETARAGELEVELAQDVTRISDEAALETSVVSLLAPSDEYAASAAIVLSAFAGNCWALERPLVARVSQLRQYYETRDGGDVAVIERRRDGAALGADDFAAFLDESGGIPALAGYCADIR